MRVPRGSGSGLWKENPESVHANRAAILQRHDAGISIPGTGPPRGGGSGHREAILSIKGKYLEPLDGPYREIFNARSLISGSDDG
jgi:hypothetical protein